jgi:hypothetical protein
MMSLVPKIWAQQIEANLLKQLHYQLKFEHNWNFKCADRVGREYDRHRRQGGKHILPRPPVLYRPPLFPTHGETITVAVITGGEGI